MLVTITLAYSTAISITTVKGFIVHSHLGVYYKTLQIIISGWKPIHLTSVFSLRTSVTLPHGTTLTAFADVKYGCLRMLDRLVSTHPKFIIYMEIDIFCSKLASSSFDKYTSLLGSLFITNL
jgi:hypothetical protein